MSVYSGFATRNQEMIYDNLLYNIISALSIRLVKFYESKQVDQKKFYNIVDNQFKYLKKIQKRKYIEPKYSQILQQLIKRIQNSFIQMQHTNPFKNNTEVLTPTSPILGRTLSMVTSEFKNLRDMGDKQLNVQNNNQLQKISERITKANRKKRRSKLKRDRSATLQLHDLWQVRAEKMPEISNYKLKQDQNYKSKNDWIRQTKAQLRQLKQSSVEKVQIQQQNLQRIMYGSKFRSRMFMK